MCRVGVLIVCALLASCGAVCGHAAAQPAISIQSPRDGASVLLGEPVVMELEFSPAAAGCPFGVRLDGKSIWVASERPYSRSWQSSEWGVGEHVLAAVVFLPEGEERSAPVRITVVPRARKEGTGWQQGIRAQDDFDDQSLDRNLWRELDSDPAIWVGEEGGELRISGVSSSEKWVEDGVFTKVLPREDVDAAVDFRAPGVAAGHREIVYLQLSSVDAARTFGVFFDSRDGYGVQRSNPSQVSECVAPYGDEATEWHRLRLTHDAATGNVCGYVDDTFLGSFRVSFGRLSVGLVAAAESAGVGVEVRFDNLAVKGGAAAGVMSTAVPEPESAEQTGAWTGEQAATAAPTPGYTLRQTAHGDYYEYIPAQLQDPVRVLVLVHGSIDPGETASDLAASYVTRYEWAALAEMCGMVMVAPAFDKERFGGYRALRGTEIGADDFLLEIVDGYAEHFPSADGRLVIYGHSAGSQFAHRFLVTHPDRVAAAALSAAGNYAYPDFNVDWPYGRNRSPNPGGFVTAATLPVGVFVGSLDLDAQTMGGAFQRGENRIERGQNWVAAMQQLAWENGLEPRVQFTLLPDIPHSSSRTGPACAEWLLGVLESGAM